MAKTARMAGPGLIVNRHAKNSKIEIAFDPSPDGFVSTARRENARLKLVIVPGTGDIEPIEITATPKIWVFKFERAQIPPERLADLEALITEEQDVHVVLEYTPQQEELPFSQHTIDPDGFVTNPIEIPVIVPESLKAEVKLLFACMDGLWFYGYEIKGRVERSRRINVHTYNGAGLVQCLNDLADNIEEALKGDKSRLAEFLGWKVNTALDAMDEKGSDLAAAMAEEIRLPADFAEGATTEGTESTEKEGPVKEPLVIKVKGLRKTEVKGLIGYRPGEGYGYEYAASLGNYEGTGASDGCCFDTRAQCLHVLQDDLICWLQELELTGTAERRRVDGQRRQKMREQIVAEIDKLIAAAEAADGVPFEEDEPRQAGHGSQVTDDEEDGDETED